MDDDIKNFYAEMSALYHLIYPDWEESIEKQASMLDGIIVRTWGDGIFSILDVSCGIGTQAIGLARRGYAVTASDLSPEAVERAKREAEKRNLSISFSVADMREAFKHHGHQFDLVVSCDNSFPHLLTDESILTAFQQLHSCTRPGGGCIVSIRDYENEDMTKQNIKLYGFREEGSVRYFIFQTWEPRGETYDLSMYFVEDSGHSRCKTRVMRSRCYAIGIPKLMDLMTRSGFEGVTRLDGDYFQPVIIGTRRT